MKSIPITIAVLALGSSGNAIAKDQAIDLKIAAGKVGEVCMALRAGDTLAWDFSASAPADFNLHHHIGKEVVLPVDRKAVAADRAQHTADRANDWCLMWTAPAAQAITVKGSWRVAAKGGA
jgi:hypothetical protein